MTTSAPIEKRSPFMMGEVISFLRHVLAPSERTSSIRPNKMTYAIEEWLKRVWCWAEGSQHRLRLHRAFLSADECLLGNPERLLHSYSRLGIWAAGVSDAIVRGDLTTDELASQLRRVAEFGEFASEVSSPHRDWQSEFSRILNDELIRDFSSDPVRCCDASGFRENVTPVGEADARDFIKAWRAGFVLHLGRGLYRTPRSAASEQFFWTGSKGARPRTFTLWHEPIITIAALGRLHEEFGWPADLLGTQSIDWAFDLVAFLPTRDDEEIAGEVKKTIREVDALIRDMQEFGSNPERPLPASGKLRNAFKKVAGLKARRAPIFWAIGPNRYSQVFRVEHGLNGMMTLHHTTEDALVFNGDAGLKTPTR